MSVLIGAERIQDKHGQDYRLQHRDAPAKSGAWPRYRFALEPSGWHCQHWHATPEDAAEAETGDCTMYSGDEIYSDDITSGPAPDPDNDEPEQDEDEPGYNYPTVYVDGSALPSEDGNSDLEWVQIEFDATANGVQSEADERAPLGWCNSAAITLDRDDDAVHVSISVGDPRGAFSFTVRRLADGRLIMHTPYPGEGMPHMALSEIRPGTYEIGS